VALRREGGGGSVRSESEGVWDGENKGYVRGILQGERTVKKVESDIKGSGQSDAHPSRAMTLYPHKSWVLPHTYPIRNANMNRKTYQHLPPV
jgi:hypothetical protein